MAHGGALQPAQAASGPKSRRRSSGWLVYQSASASISTSPGHAIHSPSPSTRNPLTNSSRSRRRASVTTPVATKPARSTVARSPPSKTSSTVKFGCAMALMIRCSMSAPDAQQRLLAAGAEPVLPQLRPVARCLRDYTLDIAARQPSADLANGEVVQADLGREAGSANVEMGRVMVVVEEHDQEAEDVCDRRHPFASARKARSACRARLLSTTPKGWRP